MKIFKMQFMTLLLLYYLAIFRIYLSSGSHRDRYSLPSGCENLLFEGILRYLWLFRRIKLRLSIIAGITWNGSLFLTTAVYSSVMYFWSNFWCLPFANVRSKREYSNVVYILFIFIILSLQEVTFNMRIFGSTLSHQWSK